MRSAALAIVVLLAMTSAQAAPPPGSDPSSPLAAWFHTLQVPQGNASMSGMLCCDIADCRPVRSEFRGDGHYWAFIDSATYPDDPLNPAVGHAPNAWLMVPDGVILPAKENPTGEPVACWYAQAIRCFVRGPET